MEGVRAWKKGGPPIFKKAGGIQDADVHRESVSGLGGFRLGFVHDPPRLGGSGLYQNALILYHLTTARGLGGWRTQRFGVLYSKFEFAVQDAIKTPKLKPPQPETLSR